VTSGVGYGVVGGTWRITKTTPITSQAQPMPDDRGRSSASFHPDTFVEHVPVARALPKPPARVAADRPPRREAGSHQSKRPAVGGRS